MSTTPRRMSTNGRRMLCNFEGFVSTIYRDAAGYPTVGYGHKLTRDEIAEQRYSTGVTRAEAEVLLERDLARFEDSVSRAVEVQLDQSQFDALVSFSYNVGTGAFERSTLLRLLNAGHHDAVPEQLKRWDKITIGNELVSSPGLALRRAREAQLWSTGDSLPIAETEREKRPSAPPPGEILAQSLAASIELTRGLDVQPDDPTSRETPEAKRS